MRIVATCLWIALASSVVPAQTTQTNPQPAQSTTTSTAQTPDNSTQAHKFHFRLGSVWASAGYVPYYGPWGFYGQYPYPGDYYPWFANPFWPGFAPLNVPATNKGEVHLTTDPKTAQVFIDGAYAGTADRLKSMWLDPGAYDLSVSTTDRETFHQRIYVLSGKSLKITARLAVHTATSSPKVTP